MLLWSWIRRLRGAAVLAALTSRSPLERQFAVWRVFEIALLFVSEPIVSFTLSQWMEKCPRSLYEKRYARVVFLLACAIGAAAGGAASDHPPSAHTERVSFAVYDQDILHALLRLGSQERIPMGIVLDNENTLCGARKTIEVTNVSLAQVMKTMLVGSYDTWGTNDGVITVKPKQIPDATARVLNMKFDKFGGGHTVTTIQGIGSVLSGWIDSTLHPGQGFAGDILSSPDSERIRPFTLRKASVEKILDYTVSLGSKGVWILHQPTVDSRGRFSDVDLHTYGYKDDSWVLKTLSCSAQ